MLWNKILKNTCILIYFIALLTVSSVEAENVFVSNVIVKKSDKGMYVDIMLSDYYSDELFKIIKYNYIPINLVYEAVLLEKDSENLLRRYKKVETIKVSKDISYNPFHKYYQIKTRNKEYIINSLKKLKSELRNYNKLYVKKEFDSKKKYAIRVRAEMNSIKLFFPLNIIYNLLSIWNFKTDWYFKKVDEK